MASIGKEHWTRVKWIMRYLRGYVNLGLRYRRKNGNDKDLWRYVDSNYDRNLGQRKSLTGYLFMLNNCLINWKASLQLSLQFLQLRHNL